MKGALKVKRFQNVEEARKKITEALKVARVPELF
jgi:hypothetical protein